VVIVDKQDILAAQTVVLGDVCGALSLGDEAEMPDLVAPDDALRGKELFEADACE
jgi:hypothetical protein